MRFIIMHKTNAYWESGATPSPALIARVGALLGELAQAGVLLGAEGLRATSEGVRLTFVDGACTVVNGPYEGVHELAAGFSILRSRSLDEAIAWATRQAEALGEDVEIDIRPVTEPWDIGMVPKPADVSTRRYMVLRKATPSTEADAAPSATSRAKFTHLIEETTRSGLHVATETMRPSRKGRRYKNDQGRRHPVRRPLHRNEGADRRLRHRPRRLFRGRGAMGHEISRRGRSRRSGTSRTRASTRPSGSARLVSRALRRVTNGQT